MGILDLSDNMSPKKHVDLMQNFDNMDGHTFEHYCAELLRQNNFERVQVTRGSGDQGVDIIAYKDEVKYAIQCKNYSSHLGNTPIQEVFAGKTFYKCDVAVVMTNQTFTQGAVDLANATGVLLWDRYKLMHMLGNYSPHINSSHNNDYMKITKQFKSSKTCNLNNASYLVPLLIIGILIVVFIFTCGLTSFADLIRAL